ncbi:MAG: response regulator [Thermodesulfobacteriota bacterium]
MEHSKARILVVDDEEEIRNSLSRHFEFDGYEVETAANGIKALEALEKKRFEVVITDIMMPEMNGVELLKHIRNDYPMTHSIVITGYVTMDNLLAALRYRADTCIFKPLEDMSELDDAVIKAVEDLKKWQKKLKELKGMKV